MRLPWPVLQDLAFEVLAAVYNKDNPRFAAHFKDCEPVAIGQPAGRHLAEKRIDADLRYLGFGRREDHGAGVMHAIARYACMAANEDPERFSFLAQSEFVWPMLAGRGVSQLKAVGATVERLHLRRLEYPGVKKTEQWKIRRELIRHILEIDFYRRAPERFIAESPLVMTREALKAVDPGSEMLKGSRLLPEPWWPCWTTAAGGLKPLSTKTMVEWWPVIQRKLLSEYENAPYQKPPNMLLSDYLQELGLIGLSAIREYRGRFRMNPVVKTTKRTRRNGPVSPELQKIGVRPEDNLARATTMIVSSMRKSFFSLVKKSEAPIPKTVKIKFGSTESR